MLDAHHRRRSPRRSRRASTIGGTDSKRRLSSYTTSSGDTAIDFENSEDEVKENIRYHKNMIESIKTQPWSMAKKLRMLRTAKAYIKKHEGELAQSKQARDIFATYSNWFRNSLHRLKREIADLIITLTPWEMRIKRIESHFGSVVASYFIFLRWVFWLNSFISLFICCFLMVPEVLRGDDDITGMRKKVKDDEAQNALNLKEVWEFEGYLKYSPIFYGYYSDREVTPEGYRLPLAYLLSSLVMYMFSFFMILRKMTSNNKQSKMIEKEDECTFAWKLYTGWDYMIGNAETAHNKVSSLVMSFKESILEEKERRKEERSWKLITLRTFTNFLVLLLLGSSAYAVILVVARGEEPEAQKSWYRQNEVTLVLTGISNVYPNFFDLIGAIEQYHPRQQLQWQLFRILMLYMLNLYTLIFALFGKVRKMTSELSGMRENITFLIESGAFDRRNSLPVEPNAAMDNLTSLDFFTELPMSPLEEFLHDAVKTFPKLDLSNCLTCSWLPIKCSLLLLILNSTFPVRVPNEMFYSVMPEPCGAIPSYNQSWCIDSAWNSSIEYNQTAQDDRDWNSSLPCPPPSTVSTTTTTTTAKTYSLEQIALFIANYTISHHFNNNLTPNGSPEVTPNDAFASNLFGSEFNVSDATNLLFYDNLSNFTSLSGNDTERPTFTLVQTSTVSVAEEDYLPVERMNCTNVYMPYCGSLPIPKELKEEEQTTASDIDYISTTSRPPGYISQDELNRIDESDKDRLRKLCWETMFGQEIVKLTVMDLAMTIGTTVLTDYIRAVFIRYLNNYCCWDMEVGWPGYGDFKIAENILHLVNNQGMVWMGMFFSPGLPAINTIKLALMMYVRSWAVLTSNIPHETVFKASGNNFYYMLLLVMLFICTLPVGYAMVWLEPSWHCGPFSGCKRAYKVFTNYLKRTLPKWLNIVLEYCCSAGAIIPLILLLVLVIYYLSSITGSLRESNNDLMAQIRREKEEKRAKKAEEESTKLSKIPLDIESKPAITNEDQAEKAEKILNMWSAASRRQSMVQKLKGSSSPLQRAVALTQEHLYKEKDDFESSETSRGPAAPSWNVAVQEHVDRARQMDRKDGRRPLRSQRSDEEPLVSSVNTSNMGYKQLEEIRAVEQLRAFREKKRRQRVPKIMISKDGTEELQASIDSEAAQKDGQTLEGPQAQESRGSKASSSTADNQPLLLDPTKSPIPIKGKKFKPTLRRETAKYPVEEDQSPGGSQSVSSNAGTSTKGSYSPSQTTDCPIESGVQHRGTYNSNHERLLKNAVMYTRP
ncbi:transmembrane channel-like protein 3 [Varroa destructor]|uniref:TMC domain-containing protein n=1 Tax=Varroa destructor TaxID=109461 RepID=A0A7M7IZC1_VARDE|nr:transmembrane channel-like protein 3 [Varroa destructor]